MRPLPVSTNGSCDRYQHSIHEPCVILVTDHASFITMNLKMNDTAIISILLSDLQTRSELLPSTHAYIKDKRSVFASEGGRRGGETTFRPTRLEELASSVTSKVTCVLLSPSPPQERNLFCEILPQGSKPATCV